MNAKWVFDVETELISIYNCIREYTNTRYIQIDREREVIQNTHFKHFTMILTVQQICLNIFIF